MKTQDTFGRALLDWVQGGTDVEIVERGDGLTELGAGPYGYLSAYPHWPEGQRRAISLARGRTADVGCGAGRVALHLQSTGVDVVGIDASRRAVRAATLAGVEHAKVGDVLQFAAAIPRFDTVVLFGNNLGLFGTPRRARTHLARWCASARPGTRLLVESTSPSLGGAPIVDREFAARNLARGRAAGQCEMRIWYERAVSEWIPWFFVSRGELRTLLRGTGWSITGWHGGASADPYVAVLEKPEAPRRGPR